VIAGAITSLGSLACSVYGPASLPSFVEDFRQDADGDVEVVGAGLETGGGDDELHEVAAAPDVGTGAGGSAGSDGSASLIDASGSGGGNGNADASDTGALSEDDDTMAASGLDGADASTADAASDADSSIEGGPLVGDVGVDTGGTVVFADNFENGTIGMQAAGWTRVGGSSGDWEVVSDTTRVFAQSRSPSSTIRLCYAGPLTSGAASVSARAKVTLPGTSGTTTAMVCLRYAANGTDYHCLGLEPGVGAQIKTAQGDGPVWTTSVSLGIWYDLKLSVNESGLLSAYLDSVLLGTLQPGSPITSGYVAIATASAQAVFDDVVLTTP
jgi:hypothetical protein